jgi:hypothetical protein
MNHVKWDSPRDDRDGPAEIPPASTRRNEPVRRDSDVFAVAFSDKTGRRVHPF